MVAFGAGTATPFRVSTPPSRATGWPGCGGALKAGTLALRVRDAHPGFQAVDRLQLKLIVAHYLPDRRLVLLRDPCNPEASEALGRVLQGAVLGLSNVGSP